MAKKRKTREQKIRAALRREASVTESNQSQIPNHTFRFVKREFSEDPPGTNEKFTTNEKAKNSIQSEFLASTSRDLIKTTILASGILALELVLYFAWKS